MIILLVIIISCTFILWVYRNIFFPRKYKQIVEQAASIYRVDPNLIYAVIKQESKFNKNAVSKSSAKGLMQIMDSTAQDVVNNIASIDVSSYDLYDPYTNILIGTKYLSYLINYYDGNYYLALTAYNAGLGKVDIWTNSSYNNYSTYSSLINVIEYEETRGYLTSVIKNYSYYTKLYN